MTTYAGEAPVLNPVAAEQKIQELSERIAKGVGVVTAAEREARAKKRAFDLAYAHAYKNAGGPAHERRYTADITAMPHREEADTAEIAFKHAERTAKALEKELLAWQSINSNLRAMYATAGVGQR
jgi:ATP-dependent DNA ligase